MHPDTTVIAPYEQYKKRYRKANPAAYFLLDTIYFPASPMPNNELYEKSMILAIKTKDGHDVYSIDALVSAADEQGAVHITVDGSLAKVTVESSPLWAIVHDIDGNALLAQRALWFAWFANHPDAVIRTPQP